MEYQETDERLLENAANGETAAFQILYERYRDPIFRFAYRMLGSAEAAEDVTHDCFLSCCGRIFTPPLGTRPQGDIKISIASRRLTIFPTSSAARKITSRRKECSMTNWPRRSEEP
ncbi:MAG: hypothetical protein DMF73_15665 [Acidobacteria bacterium]|nr:MAG: hypothetical protein DMF73_15665 [Acidobacteriota bacterium]